MCCTLKSTLLNLAATEGNSDVIWELLESKAVGGYATLNAKDDDGWTVLHTAERFGKQDCVKAMIEASAAQKSYGCVDLHWVAYEGKLDCVKRLIEDGALPNAKDNDGCTPL